MLTNIITTKKFPSNEVSVLLILAIPLILTGFIESSVGFFSTLFLAHLGPNELAAGAVVQWIFFTMMVVLWGTLCAVSVLIAQKHGAKEDKKITYILRDALILGLLFCIPSFILLRNVGPILLFIGQDPATVQLAESYMQGLSWGLLPDFIGLVLMQFLMGLGHARTNMVFTLLWVPLNIVSNYALIFGKFGMPALGMAGIGWGTTFAYWILAIILIAYLLLRKEYLHYFNGIWHLGKPKYLFELWQIGFPMGSMYCIEIAFFLTITLIMGHLGSSVLAANQITLQYLGQLSIATFAIAQAITVRMGHTLGQKHTGGAERAVYIGVVLAFSLMLLVALLYWFCPSILIGIDLNVDDPHNAQIVALVKQFLAICAVFQLLEAIRFSFFGALRGLKDTRYTLLVSVISFWIISLPIGYFFAKGLHFGGQGLWWGIVLGEICGVVMLYFRFKEKMRHEHAVQKKLAQQQA